MFNLAIDSKLRGCDVVSLTVEEVAPNGVAIDRATVPQKKIGHPVRFELSEQTREAVDALRSGRRTRRRVSSCSQVDATLATLSRSRQYAPGEIERTVRYLGIEVDDALAIAEQVDV
jgi:hypothetical protein